MLKVVGFSKLRPSKGHIQKENKVFKRLSLHTIWSALLFDTEEIFFITFECLLQYVDMFFPQMIFNFLFQSRYVQIGNKIILWSIFASMVQI